MIPENDPTGEHAIECGAIALACADCGDSARSLVWLTLGSLDHFIGPGNTTVLIGQVAACSTHRDSGEYLMLPKEHLMRRTVAEVENVIDSRFGDGRLLGQGRKRSGLELSEIGLGSSVASTCARVRLFDPHSILSAATRPDQYKLPLSCRLYLGLFLQSPALHASTSASVLLRPMFQAEAGLPC